MTGTDIYKQLIVLQLEFNQRMTDLLKQFEASKTNSSITTTTTITTTTPNTKTSSKTVRPSSPIPPALQRTPQLQLQAPPLPSSSLPTTDFDTFLTPSKLWPREDLLTLCELSKKHGGDIDLISIEFPTKKNVRLKRDSIRCMKI